MAERAAIECRCSWAQCRALRKLAKRVATPAEQRGAIKRARELIGLPGAPMEPLREFLRTSVTGPATQLVADRLGELENQQRAHHAADRVLILSKTGARRGR